MKNKLVFILIMLVMLSSQGCHTIDGAVKGFQKDITHYNEGDTIFHKADAWMREHLW